MKQFGSPVQCGPCLEISTLVIHLWSVVSADAAALKMLKEAALAIRKEESRMSVSLLTEAGRLLRVEPPTQRSLPPVGFHLIPSGPLNPLMAGKGRPSRVPRRSAIGENFRYFERLPKPTGVDPTRTLMTHSGHLLSRERAHAYVAQCLECRFTKIIGSTSKRTA